MSSSVQIKSLSHDGRGIATLNGKTIFINGALPGETVTFNYTKQHSKYAEAAAVEIADPAATRVTPKCQHFTVCGGCSLQHMSTSAQLAFKQQTLLDQLQQFAQIQPQNILPPMQAAVWGYRRKARLSVKFVRKKNRLLLGFHEKDPRFVADITRCEILDERVGLQLETLRALLETLVIRDHIPQLEVALGDTNGAIIIRHLVPFAETDLAKLQQFAEQQQLQLFLQPDKTTSVWRSWPAATANNGDVLSYHLPTQQLELLFHPTDFTQINAEINRQLVTQAVALLELKSSDRVLDLFCGLGNFTLALAQKAAEVVGIEGVAEMVERAQANARHNHIQNVRFYAANLASADLLPVLQQQQFNKVLLDPPRTGALEIIQHLSALQVERIVYVSCNPATLARDTKILLEQGYSLQQAGIMDMFPHTQHVEALAVFVRTSL